TQLQIERFREAAAGLDVPSHLANTAGSLLFPAARADLVRVGLGTYGLHPCPATREVVDLRPALRVVSRVLYVQRLAAGERPSYGRRRALQKESNVATVPIGYADGVPRRLSATGGEVLIRGRRYPLAGTVTMDQIVVDVGDDPVEVGDEVVLIGRQGTEEITADEWAEKTDTSCYEVVCDIGPRVPRGYSPRTRRCPPSSVAGSATGRTPKRPPAARWSSCRSPTASPLGPGGRRPGGGRPPSCSRAWPSSRRRRWCSPGGRRSASPPPTG